MAFPAVRRPLDQVAPPPDNRRILARVDVWKRRVNRTGGAHRRGHGPGREQAQTSAKNPDELSFPIGLLHALPFEVAGAAVTLHAADRICRTPRNGGGQWQN